MMTEQWHKLCYNSISMRTNNTVHVKYRHVEQ